MADDGSGEVGEAASLRTVEVATVRAIYDAFARMDVDAALRHVSRSVKFLPLGTAQLVGRDSPYHGHDGVRQYFADAGRVWDEITLHADEIRAVGEDIIVFGRVRGSVQGEPFERRVVWIWQVRDGLATYMRVSGLETTPG